MDAPLQRYRQKRDFAVTAEPPGGPSRKTAPRKKATKALAYVIQKHAATRLHYDFRLELDGVLLSWAVPKGPSFDPKDKRMAVHVEDHPLDYAGFEGTIPPKQYGAGTVIVWDRGSWEPVGDPREGMASGKLVFRLHGEKLAGLWELVRIRKPGDRQDPWLLFKKRDEWARPAVAYDVVSALPDSVIAHPLGPLEARGGTAAAAPPAAVKAALPARLSPQLATLAKRAPTQGEWIYEIKFDGYRIMARIEGGTARLITRGGHDWTDRMASLARAVEALGVGSAWLDGEIVVPGDDGTPDFNRLQNAFDGGKTEGIVYYLFDAPFLEGEDLRALPLSARRARVEQLLQAKGSDRVRFSASFATDAASVLRSACELKLEGVIAKRADAPYVSQRSETWLKLKCVQRQEFVVCGYTERRGGPTEGRTEIGSLLLGVHDAQGRLVFAGSVGTGWDAKTAAALLKQLKRLQIDRSPFHATADVKPGRWTRRSEGDERWVKPMLVAEVSFAEWTPDGSIRHASYHALRDDKPAAQVTREPTGASAGKRRAAKPAAVPERDIEVSHPDRVVDPSTGITKLQLARYYESVAEWILPHLAGRPVSLVRGPQGIAGELFFQKHNDTLRIKGVKELDAALWPGHAALLTIDSVEALLGAAQMNVIEFHTWNATAKRIGQPDRMVFDLDPGEGVDWNQVREAAVLTRSMLDELGLKSFLKTSGGKGLHVVVPLTPKADWETVKAFSQAVVQHMAKTIPSRFVAKSGGSRRVGKIFIDYLRNGHGQTTAAAFSARARPGLGVSMPVPWEALAELKGGAQWTVATAREHLSFQTEDPWAGYGRTRQTLATAMKRLGFERREPGPPIG